MGSYKYTKYANNIPIVEKYINGRFDSTINTGIYNETTKKFNYFVLDPDINKDNATSYILRVYTPIKNYQVFTCGAGGHGGIIYGAGGNGGNYLYIDNINNTSKELARGSYLITPGRAIDIFDGQISEQGINQSLQKLGSFYLIKYSNINFVEYKTLATINNYKKKDWSTNTNITGEIKDIASINQIQNNKVDKDKVFEFIFYLKKTKSFKFNNFQNLLYTRVIKVSNNNNINVLYTPNNNNNYTYTAGEHDEIITIVFYQNSNDSLNDSQLPLWSSIFDINYASINIGNFYIYDFINNKNYINSIGDRINNDSSTITGITYNINPDADFIDLQKTKTDVITNNYGSAGGNAGNICYISDNPGVNINYMLKRYYMPSLFAVSINLSGGNAGSTLSKENSGNNEVIKKMGGNNTNVVLSAVSGKNILLNSNTKEWFSGIKGYFSNYFKLFAYYPYDPNIEMNNTSLANGGFTGHWQFIKDEINYNYGANGLNDLKSPNYGTYGCGGQGGSILLDKNSNFTGSKGKNGVFVLSFLNQALATITNDNSIVIKKMFELFGINNEKLGYITELTDNNTIITTPPINFKGMINNLFIHKGNIHIDDTYIAELNSYIPKTNFNELIAIINIIQRIYYIISINLDLININKITQLSISFVNTTKDEKIVTTDKSEILFIYICDNINNEYISKYLRSSPNPIITYRQLLNLTIDKILILKERDGIIYDNTTSKTPIDISYIQNSNNNSYQFIISTISYIFNIQPKDFKIHVNVMETTFSVLCLNAINYVILYHSAFIAFTYSETVINNIYILFKKFNYDLKKKTDKIIEYNNIFQEQNEFKLYFNNNINDYNKYRNKNSDFYNLLRSKKSYSDTKEKLKNIVNIFTLIVFITIICLILWLIYVMVFNSNKYDAMPHLLIIGIILIIIVIVMNYFNYNYKYKEFFANPNENASQLDIFNDKEDYYFTNISYNNDDYKITFIKSTSEFILYKNRNTSIVLINKGLPADTINQKGMGGTINIYDADFVTANIKENEKYPISFNNEIKINDLIKTNSRNANDNINNIKIFYNNKNNNNSSNYPTLINYYNAVLNVDNPNNINTLTSNNFIAINSIGANSIFNSFNQNDNTSISNVSADIINNQNISEILNVLFNKENLSSYYYGASGGNIDNNGEIINKTKYPDAYGLGGTYDAINGDNTGIDGICIIINKQIEFSTIHLDVQTLINMYNNNLNKYIYDRFNKIYLIDNNVIYDNALLAFRKRYDEENIKNDKYKKYETDLNQYSTSILMDVYFRYEITKVITYIFLTLIICVIIYSFNNRMFILIIAGFIIAVIFILMYFFFNLNKNTRRDYYKYYWSKYNNDN